MPKNNIASWTRGQLRKFFEELLSQNRRPHPYFRNEFVENVEITTSFSGYIEIRYGVVVTVPFVGTPGSEGDVTITIVPY